MEIIQVNLLTYVFCVCIIYLEVYKTMANEKYNEKREKMYNWFKETFYGCKSLKEIEIPNSVKIIENSVFEDCIKLEKAIISNGVEYLYSDVFYDCKSLKEIEIPNSIISIGDRVFTGCDCLEYNQYDNGCSR